MRGFPSGPEANMLHQKAGYMYATFLWMPVKLSPCNAGRTIYDPKTRKTLVASKIRETIPDYRVPTTTCGLILSRICW